MKKTITSLMILFTFLFIPKNSKAQMFWNHSCEFTGITSRYISMPNSPTIDLTGSFTMEAWVNPVNSSNKGVISKGGALGTSLRYGMRITNSRVLIATNGAIRIMSKAQSLIPINKWTHISATYSSISGEFEIYINGALDTSTVVAGADPNANADSLFIGISGNTTPFNGLIDEVRIWNRDLGPDEVKRYFRTSLGSSSGIYSGLVLSLTFQKQSNVSPFSTDDFSGNNNHGNGRNLLSRNHSYNPSHTISQNECLEVDGIDDYVVMDGTSPALNPGAEMSLECWVNPRTIGFSRILSKRNGPRFSYLISITDDSTCFFTIVSAGTALAFFTTSTIPVNKWTHLAMTFSSIQGKAKVFVNGRLDTTYNTTLGNVDPSADSVYIGIQAGGFFGFNGYIDEVRISNRAKSEEEIYNHVYSSIDKSNDPNVSSIDVCYNFDGYSLDNAENGGPPFYFRKGAKFSHPASDLNQPRSPMIRDNSANFSSGYYISDGVNLRIPSAGTSGITSSSKQINLNTTISDVNCFVALNHTKSSSIKILMTRETDSSNADELVLFDGQICNSSDNNIVLLFDDQADSALKNNVYSSFCSKIKPMNNMNLEFGGKSTQAKWGIKIIDNASGDTGILYSFGINFNNMSKIESNLNSTILIQGFYNPDDNLLVSDTMMINLRNSLPPYAIVGSSKTVLKPSGEGLFSFADAVNGVYYFIELRHRNTIETWSSVPVSFSYSEAFYDFDKIDSSAYGLNQIQADISPVRFAFYGGDVNQDGYIDLNDISLVFNDAGNFVSGYAVSDVTGDNITDLSDLTLTFNNSSNFIESMKP